LISINVHQVAMVRHVHSVNRHASEFAMITLENLRGIIDAADPDDGDDVAIRARLVAELEIALASCPDAEQGGSFFMGPAGLRDAARRTSLVSRETAGIAVRTDCHRGRSSFPSRGPPPDRRFVAAALRLNSCWGRAPLRQKHS